MAPRGTAFIKTKVFELAEKRGLSVTELARAMGVDLSLVTRVKAGQRGVGPVFIVGAQRAFPGFAFGELFYIEQQKSKAEIAS